MDGPTAPMTPAAIPNPALRRDARWMDAFAVCVAAHYVLLAVFWNRLGTEPFALVVPAMAFLAFVAGIAFHVFLGRTARDLGRAWALWVVGSFVTSPIGPVVAYFAMRRRVNDALRATAGREPERAPLVRG